MTLLQNGRRYFDWNASSLLCDRSKKSLISNLDLIGNASSVHSEGREARNIIERSRDDVMDLLGLSEGTIIFTSGASESAALELFLSSIIVGPAAAPSSFKVSVNVSFTRVFVRRLI